MSKPTLAEYIKKYQDWFVIDDQNKKLINTLGDYCINKEKFEACKEKDFLFTDQQHLYCEKGILLIGNVGTGKTTLLHLLNTYLRYLKDMRQFRTGIIPNIADEFSVSGRAAFTKVLKGNWLLDELCFINEKTGLPDREYAMHYGDKILVGEKLIFDRSTLFLETGWQTHFTTNANLKQLKEIYGERAYSRLMEMCNVFIYTGTVNKRYNRRPHIPINHNDRVVQEVYPDKVKAVVPQPMPLSEKIKHLQDSYHAFSSGGNLMMLWDGEYELLEEMGYEMPPLEIYMVSLRAESPQVGDDILERFAKKHAVADLYKQELASGKSDLDFPK